MLIPGCLTARTNSTCTLHRGSVTFLINKSGNVLIFGCKDIDEAIVATVALALEFEDNCIDVTLRDIKLVNMVVSFTIDAVDLSILNQFFKQGYFEPELFPYLRFFLPDGCSGAVYHTGKVVLMGPKADVNVTNVLKIYHDYLIHQNAVPRHVAS